MNPVITLVIKWVVGNVDGRERGHIPKASALPDTVCPPSSTETAEPRKKAHGERDANKQSCSVMWGNVRGFHWL